MFEHLLSLPSRLVSINIVEVHLKAQQSSDELGVLDQKTLQSQYEMVTLVAEFTIERFNVGILCCFAWLIQQMLNSMCMHPSHEYIAEWAASSSPSRRVVTNLLFSETCPYLAANADHTHTP